MKNLLVVAGMLVFILVFSMAVVGCKNEDSPPGGVPEEETPDYTFPDPLKSILTMNDGTELTTMAQWSARREELKTIMQDNSYGQWRSGEDVTYSISGNTLTVKISYGGKNVQFDAVVEKPSGSPPSGGWPVILAFGALDGAFATGNPRQYALDNGYANIAVPTGAVATDSNAHTGAFYTLYPYSSAAESQTGVLMAWAWGASKVLDALEKGATSELAIDASKTIITGFSRNGKAAAVAGAFEERFKITVPVSSGAGGCAIYRYDSAGQTYDLSGYFSYNGGGTWKVDGNNPQSLSAIQGDSGGGWFNAKFRTFSKPDDLPFDQHFLLALCAANDRYLFMVNGFEWDKWTNPPGFFYNFELTKPVFDLLGVPQNIAVSMHRERHGIEKEDMVKLIKYANYFFYGTQNLTFDYPAGKPKPATWEGFMEDLHKTPFSKSVSSSNNATYEAGKPK
ncbi:MAG: hypothetical protein LBH43_11260 [Treponema sp.]|nr:hypothetical protein [Treponema sp.]